MTYHTFLIQITYFNTLIRIYKQMFYVLETPSVIELSERGHSNSFLPSSPTQSHNVIPTLTITYISHQTLWEVGFSWLFWVFPPTKRHAYTTAFGYELYTTTSLIFFFFKLFLRKKDARQGTIFFFVCNPFRFLLGV